MKFSEIPKLTQYPGYQIHVDWSSIKEWIEKHNADIHPDFQRIHTWDTSTRKKYLEYVLRGGDMNNDLLFNCPNFQRGHFKDLVLVDELQRLTSVLMFLNNEIPVFNNNYFKDFTDELSLWYRFTVKVNNLKTRKEVLRWYIEINEGYISHTKQEIEKVKILLRKEILARKEK